MKQHLLSMVSEKASIQAGLKSYYDFDTQISYLDNKCIYKVIDENKNDRTIETRQIEVSDCDGFNLKESTKLTFIIENSDQDGILIM